jgi:hypothetical protein
LPLPATLTAPPASRPTELCTAVHRRFPTTRQKKNKNNREVVVVNVLLQQPLARPSAAFTTARTAAGVRPAVSERPRPSKSRVSPYRTERTRRAPPAGAIRAVPVPPRPRRVDDHPSNRRRQKPNYLERIATLITTQELDSR